MGAAKKRTRKKSPTSSASSDETSASNLGKYIGIVTLLGIIATLSLFYFVYPNQIGPSLGRAVDVDIGDESATSLANKLLAQGLITDARYFIWYVRLTGGTRSLARGHHMLSDDASPRELMHRLERRGANHVKVVIPEGWTRFDIAKRLDALRVCTTRSFLDATEDPKTLDDVGVKASTVEGYLFPATYELALDSSPHDLVVEMVQLFDKRYAAIDERHASGLKDLSDSLGWGRREIVILASMIEKEAAVDDERPVIASVFLNRLRDPSFSPRRLQSDPTAGYGCLVGTSTPCASYTGKITHDINVDPNNAYSTYVHDGLPPGPICSPGAKSIEAAMSPALTHYFFFVAKGGGRHNFSETLGGHNAAVHGDN